MVRELLYDNTPLPLYRNALDAFSARQRATASNLANIESAGYKPFRVEFEEKLKLAFDGGADRMSGTNERHLAPSAQPDQVRHRVFRDEEAVDKAGLNGVSIEQETVALATNRIAYELVAQRTAGLFRTMRLLGELTGG